MDRNIWNAYEYRRRGSKLHRSANSIIYTMAKLDHYFKFTKKSIKTRNSPTPRSIALISLPRWGSNPRPEDESVFLCQRAVMMVSYQSLCLLSHSDWKSVLANLFEANSFLQLERRTQLNWTTIVTILFYPGETWVRRWWTWNLHRNIMHENLYSDNPFSKVKVQRWSVRMGWKLNQGKLKEKLVFSLRSHAHSIFRLDSHVSEQNIPSSQSSRTNAKTH